MKVSTVIKELLLEDRELVAFNQYTNTLIRNMNGVLVAFDCEGNTLDIAMLDYQDYRFYIRTCKTEEELKELMFKMRGAV